MEPFWSRSTPVRLCKPHINMNDAKPLTQETYSGVKKLRMPIYPPFTHRLSPYTDHSRGQLSVRRIALGSRKEIERMRTRQYLRQSRMCVCPPRIKIGVVGCTARTALKTVGPEHKSIICLSSEYCESHNCRVLWAYDFESRFL